MAKSDKSTKEKNYTVSANLGTDDEAKRYHYTLTTYARVTNQKIGEVAATAIRQWVDANVNADDLRAAVLEQLGLSQ